MYDETVRFVLLALVAGCGRVDFDVVRAGEAIAECDWGPFGTPVRLDDAVQSDQDDWGASPSADGLELVFYAYRFDSVGSGDIYDSVRATIRDPWPAATPVTAVETALRDAEPSLTADRLELVFATSGSLGERAVYVAKRAAIDQPFGAPVILAGVSGSGVALGPSEDQPFITPDGLRLVYREDTGALTTLVEATRPDLASPFTLIGPLVPRNGNDGDPTLTSDGLELVFSSDGRGGSGGFDLFTATRPAVDQPFGAVVPVAELETAMDETNPRFSADGTQLYLNWNAVSAGNHNADLFVATRSCR